MDRKNGNRYSLTTLGRHFAVAKELAGITRRLRFRDLRHSAASRLVSRSVKITTVRDVLGRSSVVSTRRYSGVAEGTKGNYFNALRRVSESVYRPSTKSSS